MPIILRSGKNSDQGSTASGQENLLRVRIQVSITLNHFSAASVFALFASIVFGITHRENTREMVRYGLYCFVMFLGGALLAGWAMWVLRR